MEKILMVCLGNICRSPLAEGIMLKLIADHRLNISVDSAGTSNYHIDEAPDKRTIQNAAQHGVNLKALRARQFKAHDLDEFDRIFVMDKSNMRNVLALAKNDLQKQKVRLLLDVLHPGQEMEVPDPYFGGEQGFEDVFKMVYAACEKIIEQ